MIRLERACAGLLSIPAVPLIAAAESAPPGSAVSVVGLLQVILALGVVLAAVALFAWFLRRWMPGQAGASGILRVVGGVMVGPKERLVVVEVGEMWLLVGVAAGSVNLLHSMPRPAGTQSRPQPAAESFVRLLKQAVAGRRREG